MGLFGKEVFILAQIIVVEDDVYMREELIDVLSLIHISEPTRPY